MQWIWKGLLQWIKGNTQWRWKMSEDGSQMMEDKEERRQDVRRQKRHCMSDLSPEKCMCYLNIKMNIKWRL